MKYMSIVLLFCMLILAVGCSSQDKQTSPLSSDTLEAASPTLPAPESENMPMPPVPEDNRLTVMDAPIYRGIVTDISKQDGVYELRLEQVEGTDFGYSSFMMHSSEKTRSDFSFGDLVPGEYIEVYYGERNDGLPPVIISANKLPPAENCVLNGELTTLEHQGNKGKLEVTAFPSGEIFYFNFDDSTQFYLDMESLKSGDSINIYHKGTFTKSIPPQGFALEVRLYTAP